jgi:hypothetical protein
MNDDVSDFRKGDRFTAAEPIQGSFNSTDVSVVNVSMGGAQIVHAQPIRIGTRSRLAFHHGQTIVSVPAQVVWSHLSQTNDGNAYRSGVRLDVPDVLYAAAINAMLREHVVERDTESLERKRLREMERELRRKSGPRIVATPGS